MYLAYTKQSKILSMVPENDGKVCPACILPLIQNENDFTNKCKKCNNVWQPEQLSKYWEQYAFVRMISHKMLPPYKANNSNTFFFYLKNTIIDNHCKIILVGLLIIYPFYIHNDPYWNITVLKTFVLSLLYTGIVLQSRASKKRIGQDPHCAACEYPKPPDNNPDSICSECGAEWNTPGNTIYGIAVENQPKQYLGMIIFFASFLFLINNNRIPGLYQWTASSMPDSALIDQYFNDRYNSNAKTYWNEIVSRNLNNQNHEKLISELISLRTDHFYSVNTSESTWLSNQITNDLMPDKYLEAYFHEFLSFSIHAPIEIPINNTITVNLDAKENNRNGIFDACIAFEGYFENTPMDADIQTEIIPIKRATKFVKNFFDDDIYYWKIQCTNPGNLQVGMVAWFIVVPANSASINKDIQWKTNNFSLPVIDLEITENNNDDIDDVPFVLPDDVIYYKRIVLNRIIKIQ